MTDCGRREGAEGVASAPAFDAAVAAVTVLISGCGEYARARASKQGAAVGSYGTTGFDPGMVLPCSISTYGLILMDSVIMEELLFNIFDALCHDMQP